MTTGITDIRPERFPWFRYDGYTFSLGLTDGTNAWLSGHSASEYDDGPGRIVVRGGMTEQARTAYTKIEAILAAAGLTFADITKLVEYVTVAGLASYPEAEAVRRQRFGGTEPSLVTVVVERLLRSDALLEVEVHATRGGGGVPVRVGEPTGTPWHRGTLREGHDGEIALPTMLPVDERGDVVYEDDFLGQYAWCLDRADALLRDAGLSLDAAVTTYDYSTPATRGVYAKASRVRRERLGGAGVYPGAGGILMNRLHAPGVLVAVDVTASRHALTAVNPGWTRYDGLTYSPGIQAGRTLYMSGFAALDMQTQEALHPGDVVAQAETTYEAVLRVLAAAGAGPQHLVETVEYVCPDGLAGYREVARVRQRLLRAPWPASTGVVCAGLLRPEFLLEVFPTAVLPEVEA
jgi:enamine deaminase RidA (YjgF/YER057c/UK114 family)